MSIVLKTDPGAVANAIDMFGGKLAELSPLHRDCLAAHAMQMAIEEAKSLGWSTVTVKWMDERAAANLARLMGEGK